VAEHWVTSRLFGCDKYLRDFVSHLDKSIHRWAAMNLIRHYGNLISISYGSL
jgi:hypothetical protein